MQNTFSRRFHFVFAACLFSTLGLTSMDAHGQASDTPSSTGAQQGSYTGAAGTTDPCLDPNVYCRTGSVFPNTGNTGLDANASRVNTPSVQSNGNVYVDAGGFPTTTNNITPVQPTRPDPPTDFQRLTRESTGVMLPIFGQDLFQKPPSTFAPADEIPVTPDYVIGPGDEVVLRIWGHTNFNGRLTVDRGGFIYIPQVGSVHVAGEHYSDLQAQIGRELDRTYRNYEFSVNLGRLRSIQVFVMGEARRPGAYTVSGLSTALNAIFSSGGPTPQGSMRRVEIRRNGQLVATTDLYNFLLKGDKSKDVPLQAGDVIYIPFVGPQVAISGAVKHPAIYELGQEGTTVNDLLQLVGGFSATASESRLSIERIQDHRERRALTIALDDAGLHTRLIDGDILRADSVLRAYRDSVTVRGNLANAGRFPWHPGMRLSEIIPDRDSLLTPDYWTARNRLGLPTPLFQPLLPAASTNNGTNNGSNTNGQNNGNGANGNNIPDNGVVDNTQPGDAAATGNGTAPATRILGATGQREQVLLSATQRANQSTIAEQQESAADRLAAVNTHRVDITIPAPEIDWSYAVIERLNAETLRNSLVPFNLGRLVINHDNAEDKLLEPGDVVTILSQSDIHVGQDEQTKYVRLEGEFVSSGVYSVAPGETLADVVKRAGGMTHNAYLYGASFTRESARVLQQQRLDEYLASVERQYERTSAIRSLSTTTPFAAAETPDERALLEQLRRLRATGRVVLEFKPDSTGEASVPALPLENGDSFRVPSRPAIVSVVGSVYGQNVFLYNGDRRVRDYLGLSGKPTRIADKDHAFIIRADGSVLSREAVKSGLWGNNFNASLVFPGDTIVVPEKPVRPTKLRDILDYATIFSQFGVGAAAITVLK